MEFQFTFNFIFLFLFLSFLYLLVVQWKKSRSLNKKLPPGPWKLPFIGSVHHLALEGGLPHHALTNLGKKYGPFMHLQVGEISTVVVSSMDMAREDLFIAGTETTTTTTIWAMTEMIRNPSILAKAQTEVREAFKGKETFNEDVIEELKYLKQVVKETLRLHPPLPFLIPRECREETNVNGYTIPLKTRVIVNVYSMGRDPKYWEDAESFIPERFEHSSVDFMGNNFEYLPFGAGRRMCPGMSFGLINVYLPLANLLYHFDWKLPHGVKLEDVDMNEFSGIAAARKSKLYLIATPYYPSHE